MSGIMNEEQRQLVKKHLDLVPRMVRTLTRNYSHLPRDEFEELTQTGYLALCHAAIKRDPLQPFPPYAKTAIRNAIYDYWRDCGKRKSAFCSLDALLATEDQNPYGAGLAIQKMDAFSPEQTMLYKASVTYLKELEHKSCSSVKKGIASLRLQQNGYTSTDLARIYGVSSNHVRAWQSKARKQLKQDQELYALLA